MIWSKTEWNSLYNTYIELLFILDQNSLKYQNNFIWYVRLREKRLGFLGETSPPIVFVPRFRILKFPLPLLSGS